MIERLKKRADFLRTAKGRRWSGSAFALQMRPRGEDAQDEPPRLGFTATKRLGGAVTRNRAKRRLRAAAAEIFPALAKTGCDYVLIARPGVLTCEFAALLDDLRRALVSVARKNQQANRSRRSP